MNGHRVSIGIGRAAIGAILILLVFLLATVNRNLHMAQEDNQRLTEQIAEQQAAAEAREAELLSELEQLRRQVESLEEQVRQLGGNPVTEAADTNPGTTTGSPGSDSSGTVNEEPVPQPPPPPVVSNSQPAPEPDPPVVRDESSGPVNEILDTVDELVCTVPLMDC